MRRLIDWLSIHGGEPVPHTDHNAHALIAWAQAEHGVNDPSPQADWNLLNTTWKLAGSWTLPGNTASVQEYGDAESGITATGLTLLQTNPNLGFVPIMAALRKGDSARDVLKAVEASKWGTSGLAERVLPDVRKHYWTFASAPVAGS